MLTFEFTFSIARAGQKLLVLLTGCREVSPNLLPKENLYAKTNEGPLEGLIQINPLKIKYLVYATFKYKGKIQIESMNSPVVQGR